MRVFLGIVATMLISTSGLADPSQASFAPSEGLAGTKGAIEVVDAKTPVPTRREMRYWISMDSTRSSQFVVRVQRMEFDDGAICEEDACVLQWLEGHAVNPGERFLIMAEKPIASLDLFVSDGTDFQRFATIDGPFAECRRDTEMREGHADGGRNTPRIAIAPFPSDPQDLVVDCVR